MRFNLTLPNSIGQAIKDASYKTGIKENEIIRKSLQAHYMDEYSKFKLTPNEFTKIKLKSLSGYYVHKKDKDNNVIFLLSTLHPEGMSFYKIDKTIECSSKMLEFVSIEKDSKYFVEFKTKSSGHPYALMLNEDEVLILMSPHKYQYLDDLLKNPTKTMVISKNELNLFFDPVVE